uniref:TNF superfamily member 15 n=1 Tax=Podarcis muralis TaxID=64176 RepID=A0A670JP98_PODMU|nr:tumor necrosis factor ligand superfamily member 15 isoform X3 [Podarcis muralis]
MDGARMQQLAEEHYGYRWERLAGDLRRLQCLALFCLLLLVLLAMPVIYLLGSSLRCKQDEMSPETLPIFQKQEASPANYSESKPKIHLSAIKQNSSCANNVLPILEWTVRRNEQHSPMKYFNGFLVIPKNGYYFVYTQVTFRCPDGTCENIEYCGKKGVDVRNVMQVVSLKSPSYPAPRPIMKGESSIDNYGKWKKTIYVGGIFQLWEDDTLMVNVSNPALVGFGGEGDITYFGAFLI